MNKRPVLALGAVLGGTVLLLLTILTLQSSVAASRLRQNMKITSASGPNASLNGPDVIIDIQAEATVLAGQTISYTILYSNTTVLSLSDVIITDTISPKQTFGGTFLSQPLIPTSSFTYTGDFDDGYTLQWNLGDLDPQAHGSIIFTTTVPPDAQPPWKDSDRWPLLGNSAVITTSTPGVSTGNPDGEVGDSVSVMVVGPVLRLSKSDEPDPCRPGRLLTYNITLESKEREDAIEAHGVVITDRVPDNTSFVSASPPGIYSPTTGLVTWELAGSLSPDTTVLVTFTVRLDESMPDCSMRRIYNRKQDYNVRADELPLLVTGNNDANTNVDDVLEKSIETPDPPHSAHDVFPGGTVTYTISIYNPRLTAVSGLRLTDTLPGQPDPFVYLGMVTPGPTPVITQPVVVWENLSLPAGGVLTFTFRARVPTNIDVGNGSKEYKNELEAGHPDLIVCPMHDTSPSNAKVQTQIKLSKSVEPNHVLSGERVTYTIMLQNQGNTLIHNVRLTDTLPHEGGANFYYVAMVQGPEPVYNANNLIAWGNLTVPVTGYTLIFQAVATGWPLETYKNVLLEATSPETSIADKTNTAGVFIDSPLTTGKWVNPMETFAETEVEYDVAVCNAAIGTYTIDQFKDQLPPGFYADGSSTYHYDISPPEDLAPGQCWYHDFKVYVSVDIPHCDNNLPHTYKNEAGHVWIHSTSPNNVWFINASDLAPLRVNPHVIIYKEADHKAVLPGEFVVYTITLDNASSVTIYHVEVVDELHTAFEYDSMISGDVPYTTTPAVKWQNQTVPAGGQLVLVFRARVVTSDPGNYSNRVTASTPQLVCIKDTGQTARVRVVEEIIEQLSKSVNPDEAAPLGIVEYTIKLKNADSVPITGVTVTDTLPSGLGMDFDFVEMTHDDPEPSEFAGQQVIWRDLTVPGDGTLQLRFKVRVSPLFGVYYNRVSAWCPRGQIIEEIQTPVTVLPGIALYKTVAPTHTFTGGHIVYAVTLNNQSQSDVTAIRITDTLPDGFHYYRKLDGPAPVYQVPPVVAWQLDKLEKGKSQDFGFEVKIDFDVVTGTYFNRLDGYSPDVMIPSSEETAPVYVQGLDISVIYLPLTLRDFP